MKEIIRISIGMLFATLIISFVGIAISSPITKAAQATVNLRTAAPFAILSGTPNITDSPTSTITGNVGLSPATGAGIGLLSTQVTGTIYAVDGAGPAGAISNPTLLTTAKSDLTAAYLDAQGRTPFTTIATELGGTTKTTGVYDSVSTTFQITAGAGPLILDGQGDPNAVFIFEMGSDGTSLTVGPGSEVRFAGGATACNVFWVVDTASIDTTATFKGNILALNSITVNNGANIEGRLLARNGNVTLINDIIRVPVCTSATNNNNPVIVPALPNTGLAPKNNTGIGVTTIASIIIIACAALFIRKKTTK